MQEVRQEQPRRLQVEFEAGLFDRFVPGSLERVLSLRVEVPARELPEPRAVDRAQLYRSVVLVTDVQAAVHRVVGDGLRVLRGRHRHGAAGPGRAVVELEGEGAERLLARRVDGAEVKQEILGRSVRVDTGGILHTEQVLERGVRGDPLHDDVEFPVAVPVVEDDGVPHPDGRLLRRGDADLDCLASRLHLSVVAAHEVEVVLALGRSFLLVVRARRCAAPFGVAAVLFVLCGEHLRRHALLGSGSGDGSAAEPLRVPPSRSVGYRSRQDQPMGT